MNKTMLVMVQEIRATTRRKMFILFGFVLPILMGIISLVLIIVNDDGAGATQPLIDNESITSEEQLIEGYVDVGGLIQMRPEFLWIGWLNIPRWLPPRRP